MKKLHTFAFYALATPVLTLGAGSVLAQQSDDQDIYGQEQGTQHEQGAMQETPRSSQSDQSMQRDQGAKYSNPVVMEGEQSTGQENRGFMSSAPANGVYADNLIGAEVKNSANEDVGEVNDLIIDENGQVVAVVVSVGGFLGMGERDVAIGWDDITTSVTSDDLAGISDGLELQIDATREELSSAPEFEKQE